MMQNVDESMAGRAGIVEMLGISFREMNKSSFVEPFRPFPNFLFERRDSGVPVPPENTLWEFIYKGDLPELYSDSKMDPKLYYDSYIDTYVRRDVRDLAHVGDLTKFNRFLMLTAHLHGQILNKSDLASKAGVSFATAERWLSILEASNIIYLLKPFFGNTRKRLVKMPKLYFLNSGLLSRLRGFTSANQLRDDRDAGAYFEGFVLAELIKSHLNASGSFPELYYYRDSNKKEIDFVLVEGLDLYPIEVKMSTRGQSEDIKSFRHLDEIEGYTRKSGGLISNASTPTPLGDKAWVIPVGYL